MRAAEFMRGADKALANIETYRRQIQAEQDGEYSTDTANLASPLEQITALYKTGSAADAKRADAILDAKTRNIRPTKSAALAARLVAKIKRRRRDEDRHDH